mmetsp:Transcript_2892/g.7051  ORF Transcript_2892/g.7051 Transcript_2892/m.7051 type:complete len:372 (-) Transcript_2892:429-1544(-)|eukprot:CAMPEP_0177656074 /NCGR_PEP_ID=MMETSP0447-20121125/15338_1 /TAXON_ID=0 /ORGANISM="Stygamoeba regulata, Strain BSH-02190019" /LENGTH=371 /DNA_ID=CAMNT_0019160099 /DNA_START=107 /DNA_END=1222 /DNA_ORIENTATION=+
MEGEAGPVCRAFVPYPKTYESSAGWRLSPGDVKRAVAARVTYVATEKIHGSNVSLLADGSTVRAAKRTAILGDDELASFFGLREHVQAGGRFYTYARAAFAEATRRWPVCEAVALQGELHGGAYPHPLVPPLPTTRPVQVGVWYSPRLEWVGFGCAVVERGARRELSFDEASALCSAAGVPFVVPLCRGRFEHVLAFAQRHIPFETRVPACLGLPRIEGNMAEGLVLRPVAVLALGAQRVRPSLKMKHAAFSEVEAAGRRRRDLHRPAPPGGVEGGQMLFYELQVFLTPARVAAVVSKLGVPQHAHQAAAVADAVVADMLEAVLDDAQTHAMLAGADATSRDTASALCVALARELVGADLAGRATPLDCST